MNKANLDQLIEAGYDFDIKKVFLDGWNLFLVQPIYAVSFAGFILSIQLLTVMYFREFALLYSVFLAGPLFSGFFLVANKLKTDQIVEYADFFKGFKYYIPILLIWLISQILVFVGFMLFVIPGVYLMVGYTFAVLITIFTGLDFWNALEYSRKIITVRWWKFFILVFLLLVMNVLGALVFVGLLVTFPLTFYVIYCAFEEVAWPATQDTGEK